MIIDTDFLNRLPEDDRRRAMSEVLAAVRVDRAEVPEWHMGGPNDCRLRLTGWTAPHGDAVPDTVTVHLSTGTTHRYERAAGDVYDLRQLERELDDLPERLVAALSDPGVAAALSQKHVGKALMAGIEAMRPVLWGIRDRVRKVEA